MGTALLLIAAIIIAGAIVFGVFYKKSEIDKKIAELNRVEDKVSKAEVEAKDIMRKANLDSESKVKEAEIKAKEAALRIKEDAEKEIKASKQEISKKEGRLSKREETLDAKLDRIEKRSSKLDEVEKKLGEKEKEVEVIIEKQQEELEKISGLTEAEARDILLSNLKSELVHESAGIIKDFESKIDEEKERISKRVLATAIGKASTDFVADATVSVVQLPNDEMKGRIIGREGRNIRAIEQQTGVDVIIDDTPEAVVLSCFDGVKREIARNALEKLVNDGRIHPAKIEEAVTKARKEVEKGMMAAAEAALFELNIHSVHPEVMKAIGRLKYRTSYGQNILTHSIEIGHIAATLASEIGADPKLAKRSGFLHDIGKVLTHETEASHALIGKDFLLKYGESEYVANGAASHHNEEEYNCIESILVQAADAISASRPGARRETLSTYIKRLEDLEQIANSFQGVESSYAIQAGREIRILINPEKINDDDATVMSREVAKKIEEGMQYPGQIKVTIIRETRSVDYAK